MTDVEPKTPNKRKSPFVNKNSAKKAHGNENTPKKNMKGFSPSDRANEKQGKRNTPFGNKKSPKPGHNTPQQEKVNATPQKQKTPNLLNGNAKLAQKQNSAAQNKKMKPFPGTAQLQSPKIKKEKPDPDIETAAPNVLSMKIKKEKTDKSKKVDKTGMDKGNKKPNKQNESSNADNVKEGKKRRKLYATIKEKVREGDAEALASIREKIQAFLERKEKGDFSKTATRKLHLLQRLEKTLEEKVGPANVKPKQKKNDVAAAKQANKPTKVQPAESKKQEKKKQQNKSAPPSKKTKLMVEEESDEEVSDEDNSGEEEESEEEESDANAEADDSDEEDEDSDDDDDSDDDSPLPPPKKEVIKKTNKSDNTVKSRKLPKTDIKIDDLKKEDLLPPKQSVKNKTRYVVFVGNIAYDTTKEDLINHFQGCGTIRHIRIPTEKKGDRPRGFGYVEVADEQSYQQCLSKHHSFLKGRRINVLYTHGGKKKGENEKQLVKAKNFKLQALRKEGKLSGSIKENQKRSFRRKKHKNMSEKADE
nr:unnamed protein product [Callosobruchus analis]